MSNFTDMLNELVDEKLREVYQGFPGQIDQFDKNKMRAAVIPLLSTETPDGEFAYPVLSDIPVNFIFAGGFYIRPDYQKGDFVWITWSSYDYDDALDELVRPETFKRFNMASATVAGGIVSDKFNPPSQFNDAGLLLGHIDGNNKIQLEKDKININTKVNLGNNPTEPMVLGDKNIDTLEGIQGELDNIAKKLSAFGTTQAAASIGVLAPLLAGFTTLIADMTAAITSIAAITSKINATTSNDHKLT